MQALQLVQSYDPAPRSPQLDTQLVQMLNEFSENRAGDVFLKNCRNIHKMFQDRFGKLTSLTFNQQNYLSKRGEAWTDLVEETYNAILEARCYGEAFNTQSALAKLTQFLRKTDGVLKII